MGQPRPPRRSSESPVDASEIPDYRTVSYIRSPRPPQQLLQHRAPSAAHRNARAAAQDRLVVAQLSHAVELHDGAAMHAGEAHRIEPRLRSEEHTSELQ